VTDRPAFEIIAVMNGVREYAEGRPVELFRDNRNGRIVVRAFNEDGHNETRVDILDLISWLRAGFVGGRLDDDIAAIAVCFGYGGRGS